MIAPESRRKRVEEHADVIDPIAGHDPAGLVAAMRRRCDAPYVVHIPTQQNRTEDLNPWSNQRDQDGLVAGSR